MEPKFTTNRSIAASPRVGMAPRAVCLWVLFGVTSAVAQGVGSAASPTAATGRSFWSDFFQASSPTNALTGGTASSSSPAWWQTNQPPSMLSSGSQLGTQALDLPLSSDALAPAAFFGPAPTEVPPALRWGPVTAHPHLSYGLSYGDGLLASRGQKENSFLHTIAPGLRLDVGKHWSVDYTPRLVIYDAPEFRDTVSHDVALDGSGQKGDWALNLSNIFSDHDSPLVETGRQTQQTLNSTQLGASYPLAPQWQLDLSLSQNLRWTGEFNNTLSWSTLDSIRYRIREKTDVGLSLGIGYDVVDPGSDMMNERVMASLRGAIGSKFNYSLSGGLEFRQFIDTDAGTEISPIFDASLGYELTSTTLLNVHFTEQVTPSYLTDEYTVSTVLEGGINQRLFGKLNLMVSAGVRWADYRSTIDPGTLVSTGDYDFARIGLGARFLQRGSVSLYYSISRNRSTIDDLSFSSHQVGMQLSYGF